MMKAVLLILSVMVFGVGCSDKKGPRDTYDKVIAVKGDPIEFVRETSPNYHRALPTSFFKVLKNLNSEIVLLEERYEPMPYSEVVADQMTVDQRGTSERMEWKREDRSLDLVGESLELRFSLEKEGYALKFFRSLNESYTLADQATINTFQIIHQSLKKDQTAASILIYFGAKGSRRLLRILFFQSENQSFIEKVSEKYLYLLGAGEKTFWKNPKSLSITACGTSANYFKKTVSDAAAQWEVATKSILKFKIRQKKNCPPFSDLNTQTIHFVDAYVELPEAMEMVEGTTLTSIDSSRGLILDSDIFIYKKEFEDYYASVWNERKSFNEMASSPLMSEKFSYLFVHELGHFLGLHHQPDKNVKSVMSYEDGIFGPQSYDIEALRAAYR